MQAKGVDTRSKIKKRLRWVAQYELSRLHEKPPSFNVVERSQLANAG